MNPLDYAVLFASILGIALYGIIRTRGRRNLHDYLRGKKQPWFFIGLSVMATQASAITFISTPGQAYTSGMGFVQNYFAIPLALVIIAAFFLPIYRKLNVYTAYEYLGSRFDKKTRLLAAALFLLQRGLGAGITIYAPAIVLSTVFGWSLPLTIIGAGLVVTAYTVTGGSDAVTHTQKYQLGIIFVGMITAFIILVHKIPGSFTDAITLAGHFDKTEAVSFSTDLKKPYTVWTGMFGGIFLMLSYFGTDQSQVQRYISGDNLRESRLGLMFNAFFKIPMQFGILLLGVMLFVFYQFNPSPIFFNKVALEKHLQSSAPVGISSWMSPSDPPAPSRAEGDALRTNQEHFNRDEIEKREAITRWLTARAAGNASEETDALKAAKSAHESSRIFVEDTRKILHYTDPYLKTNDSDYVFITFILENLPHGLIGLLVACFFAAALSSKAAELNALSSTTIIDFYRYFIRTERTGIDAGENVRNAPPTADDKHYVRASKVFTIAWGLFAIAIALFADMSRNLIEASNILGSVFSGVVLGLFLLAFFFKKIHGTATFCGALIAQALVFGVWFLTFLNIVNIAYLWFNLIGCLAAILFAALIQLILGQPRDPRGFPVIIPPQPT